MAYALSFELILSARARLCPTPLTASASSEPINNVRVQRNMVRISFAIGYARQTRFVTLKRFGRRGVGATTDMTNPCITLVTGANGNLGSVLVQQLESGG